ncbi:hypothetical protein FRC20_007928, partial [Serendipita sp. 405]
MAAYEKTPHSPTPINASSSSILKGDMEVQSPIGDIHFQDEKLVEERPGRATPTRKYSVEWWKTTWSGAVRVGKWPRIVYCGIGLVFIVVWIGIMLSLVDQEMKHEAKNTEGKSRRNSLDISDEESFAESVRINPGLFSAQFALTSPKISLQGSIVNFNIEKRALTVSWSGLYSPNTTVQPVPLGNSSDLDRSLVFPDGIEIYRDISATPYHYTWIDTDDPTGNMTYDWISYETDNKTAVPIGVIGAHTWDSFETDITFTQKLSKNAWRQPLLGYPFDQWEGKIVFVANDREIGNISNHTRGAVFGLSRVRLTDSTLNWRFDYDYEDACAGNSSVNWSDINTYPQNCHL